ncbi:Plasmodium exported protein, unknown function [Plasmodium knowlesi strain H]|uniref:Tryptophan/threonine-rich plasmodium antigen C-terminal domain-containing protein n=3 Tax=Plasmodium knowlesi TaxID=5850 RepID=A0A5K1V7N9_PLAKH|nr:tryptophan-rich antigen [Plasmodium knowlesi strain H]OTN67591.1 Uncharacterized protein PKNOH_S05370800 [Plasmodium knowlesi]CAA9990299.1 tryptophan-rich antigen [Plasmodium knowlesi strain H]SBO19505.1 Plasmodium exported protein, unknown function [Plasmodium knowlesi strain H]SBO22826.1 Plasmodium exported protein, unknown function [Plasmodium knowlesi strain H]VVS79773.1 tryptophan-rich antigen [Plasmodium knowlesi strain H]|eukprot:XP_002260699.1 hypothetical protein, conserved in Plasmodium species [Plasmodium knowlesi strain H]
MQSQCGSYQFVGTREERKMDEKKSTQRSSFFTKKTAILFFVAAYIFLKHQDDAPRQGVSTSLQVRNQVGRILRTNEENAPMEEEELGGEVYEDDEEIHRHTQHAYEEPYGNYENPGEGYEDPRVYYELPYGNYENPGEVIYYYDEQEGEYEYERRKGLNRGMKQGGVYPEDEWGVGHYHGAEDSYEDDSYDDDSYEDDSYEDDAYEEEEEPVHEKIQIRIPRDELVDENTPIFDLQHKYLSMAPKGEKEKALYPLKPEDLQTEVSKFTDWNAFKKTFEEDWETLEVKLRESSKWLMQKKNNEWSNWIQLVKNKWSVHGKVPNEEELDESVVEPDSSNGTWDSCFKTQVYPTINAQLKNWFDDTYSYLFKLLLKGLVEIEDKKMKGWLMYHWKMNEEDDDYKTFGDMPTAKFLNLVQSQEWYLDNPHIDKQRRELMLWFFHKINDYLGKEWENWNYWKNEKMHEVKLLCEKFAKGCLNEEEWNKFLSEIKF